MSKKRFFMLSACCLLLGAVLGATLANRTPILRGFLRSNLDANLFAVTNLGSLQIISNAAAGRIPVSDANGTLALSDVTLDASKITSGTMATARLGSGSANANTLLHGNQAYVAVAEADLGLADNTTANASTNLHGLLPKLPNDDTVFLNGKGAFSAPAGTGGGGGGGAATNFWTTLGLSGTNVTGFNPGPGTNYFKLVLTGNAWFGPPSTPPTTNTPYDVTIWVQQNGTGGYTVGW